MQFEADRNFLGHLLAHQIKQLQSQRFDQAEALYKRAVGIRENAVSADNSKGALGPTMLETNLASVLENYADLLKRMNRQSEADKLLDRAKAVRARKK